MCDIAHGGTNEVRHARDGIAAIEEGIVKDGVYVYRLKLQPRGRVLTEAFLTNQCAVIRDTKGIVTILPVQYLRRYADAGLVRFADK